MQIHVVFGKLAAITEPVPGIGTWTPQLMLRKHHPSGIGSILFVIYCPVIGLGITGLVPKRVKGVLRH
jgi:hypothetical protein